MNTNKKRTLQGWQKLLILLLILLIAIGGYAGLNKYNADKAKEEAATISILSVKESNVLSFTYELQGVVYTFEREDSKSDWVYQQDPSVDLDQDSVSGILTRAADISTELIAADNLDNASDFGVDQPELTISMTLKDGSVKTVLVGSFNSMTSDYYATVEGDGRIFTVTSDFYSTFTSIDDLVATASEELSASVD